MVMLFVIMPLVPKSRDIDERSGDTIGLASVEGPTNCYTTLNISSISQ